MKEENLIKKSKYSDAQIMSILEQAENGVPVAAHAEESMQNDWLKEALGKSGKAVSKTRDGRVGGALSIRQHRFGEPGV